MPQTYRITDAHSELTELCKMGLGINPPQSRGHMHTAQGALDKASGPGKVTRVLQASRM